ncbi:Stk1 family PASTA domain-containing Ser/Thr kinase [Microbacterium sp.]|uniref:Stk1 family PASTA domain-containing Ser/Thr kinase n=1 Tax=Microbacterium sp. TaxID=51671 RepID=UPI001AC19B34|nr:Stk1 family PASTA domain-containing Ser/Thr kinase [Microbacterium sp.]MBN9191056.1 Stk1 family PASTA domain-containing Ser/Thr kinase [Microbacterium sp.]
MSTSQQADPLIGRLVDGRYRVRARIARGGMATVYVATDLRLERRVALKVMHGHLSDDAVFQSRFIQEARAAARLADPNVVNVFDQGQDDDMAYLVMEYLPGITLRDLLREQRRLTIPQAITIMDAVLSGLAAAHRAGIVHRDVKPENVLLAEDGRIKIGDFGLARATTANTATGQMLLGTIAYLAPELVTRGTADARSDIYALGIMLYEMLTGEQPYKGEQPMQIAFQHATDSVPRPSVKNPGIPEPLDELVLWATERTPDDRPADADEMLHRLREIEQQLGIAPQVQRTLAVAGVTSADQLDSDEFTKVLPSNAMTTAVTSAAVDDADNATRLRRRTKSRAAKGAWLVALVLVLAVLAGGTGWWFGSGPGSLVAIPAVEGKTFDQARIALAAQSLRATQKSEYSLDVAAGRAIRTEPRAGSRVDKDARVDVVMSLGPAVATIPALIAKSESDARGILATDHIEVDAKNTTFYTDYAAGTVVGTLIHPAGGGKDVECGKGCTAHQGDSATLWVSLGPLPSVVGKPADDAVQTLKGLGITVSDRTEAYSSDVAKGSVVSMGARSGGGWWRPGDSTTLVVSKGPQPIAVPPVNGMTVHEAFTALQKAGFTPLTSLENSPFWDIFPATGTDPATGTLQLPGTKVKILFAGS